MRSAKAESGKVWVKSSLTRLYDRAPSRALAEQYQLEFVDLEGLTDQRSHALTETLARRWRCVRTGDGVFLAVADHGTWQTRTTCVSPSAQLSAAVAGADRSTGDSRPHHQSLELVAEDSEQTTAHGSGAPRHRDMGLERQPVNAVSVRGRRGLRHSLQAARTEMVVRSASTVMRELTSDPETHAARGRERLKIVRPATTSPIAVLRREHREAFSAPA